MSELQIGWKILANLCEVRTTEIGFARCIKSLFLRTLLTHNYREHMSHRAGMLLGWAGYYSLYHELTRAHQDDDQDDDDS